MCTVYILFILQLLNVQLQVAFKSLYVIVDVNRLKFLYFAYSLLNLGWFFDLYFAWNIYKYTDTPCINCILRLRCCRRSFDNSVILFDTIITNPL